jgi:predicted metal-dependent enzyme (double-stranded beta helix superfamily)
VPSFDAEGFVEDCLTAVADSDPIGAVAEVVTKAVSTPDRVAQTVSFPLDPDDEGILYQAPDLLVVQVVFPAQFVTGIHNHTVPAIIGTWAGYEDNLLFRYGEDGRLRPAGQRRLNPSEVLIMQADEAHDVHAPTTAWTGGLHVYLGDINSLDRRSMWDGEQAEARPFDPATMGQHWDDRARATGLVKT